MINTEVDRRDTLVVGMIAGLTLTAMPKAQETSEMSLDEALRQRRSARVFIPDSLDSPLLLSVAWAAQGVNRPTTGLRTAPSCHGAADTILYLADDSAVRRYDHASHTFEGLQGEDIRGLLSPQPIFATASISIIHMSNVAAMPALRAN